MKMISFIPPYILMKLIENGNDEAKEIAYSALFTSREIYKERRRSVGYGDHLRGNFSIMIYDCENSKIFDKKKLIADETSPSANADATVLLDNLRFSRECFQSGLGIFQPGGDGIPLDAFIRYDEADACYWHHNEYMVFGDGDKIVFDNFISSIEIVTHELTHGITNKINQLEYRNQSGAISESLSDVFGSLVKQRRFKQDAQNADWLIGNGVFKRGKALRSLKEPGEAFDDSLIGRDPQPSHMNDYKSSKDDFFGDYGGVHINCGIPNKAFYLAAAKIGGDAWDPVGALWFSAFKKASPTVTFAEFAQLTINEAKLREDRTIYDAVVDAWKEVGIEVPRSYASKHAIMALTNSINDKFAALDNRFDDLADQIEMISKQVAQLASGTESGARNSKSVTKSR